MTNRSVFAIDELIQRARGGDREALGRLLEEHRAYLKLLAQRQLDGRLAARLDASDLAQQTCLSAVNNFATFEGRSAGEFVAWLKRIHERNLQNVLRDHLAARKRAAGREASLADDTPLAVSTASPSQRALDGENAVALARALEKLPSDQQEAVRLRYLEGLSMHEISRQMNRSRDSVVALIKRGILNLRKDLQ